jgi:hypothetical protein
MFITTSVKVYYFLNLNFETHDFIALKFLALRLSALETIAAMNIQNTSEQYYAAL